MTFAMEHSVVSAFLFDCGEKDLSTFISNLDGLREYAYLQIANAQPMIKRN